MTNNTCRGVCTTTPGAQNLVVIKQSGDFSGDYAVRKSMTKTNFFNDWEPKESGSPELHIIHNMDI